MNYRQRALEIIGNIILKIGTIPMYAIGYTCASASHIGEWIVEDLDGFTQRGGKKLANLILGEEKIKW